ncbi:MAG TPA: hypothetical protein ENK66_03885 [Arcobacter sp.]|nr:hypothetical protein [Arcobacter sp.]
MHLTKKQVLILFFPIIASLIVYILSTEIISFMKYIYPDYQEYNTKSLNKNVQIYNELAVKKETFNNIQKKVQQRKEYAKWMSSQVLYQKGDSYKKENNASKRIASTVDVSKWRLEATFPTRNVAIINGKIIKLGSTFKQVKIVSIKDDKVLLQYKKGFQWVYMFK